MAKLFVLPVLFISIQINAQITTVQKEKHSIRILNQIPCSAVKDQYLSSTCWSFAGNSFFESELIRNGKKNIDLSEMYTARLAWLQKIHLHLKKNGLNCLTPGGQFHTIQWVMKEYGMAPEEVYNGKPAGEIHHNHTNLDTAITRFVKKLVRQKKQSPDAADWRYINSILDRYLGKLPVKFTVQGQQYNPKTYMQQYLQIKPEDYVEITSYTHHPYYKGFVLENEYNFSDDLYMNLPFNELKAITDSALMHGYTVLWNGDVSDEGFNFANGAAYLDNKSTDIVSARQSAFQDSTSYLDHVMHIVGLAKDELGHTWYYVKNSWGVQNELEGFLLMDENYFAIKTTAIVVNKKAIPIAIGKKIKW